MIANVNANLRRILSRAALFGGAGLLVLIAVLISGRNQTDAGQVRQLPDGSSLELRQVAVTATNYNYSHGPGRLARLVAPILPRALWIRFNLGGGGGFGFSNDGANLVVITVNRTSSPAVSSSVGRLQLFDDQGNLFDSRWGAHTLGLPGETVHGWQIQALPRRSRVLGLRFLVRDASGIWTHGAEFRIPNPFFAEYPQWNADPWPATKTDGDLAATLNEFQSGARMSGRRGLGAEAAAARKTRVVFSFRENGRPSEHWRVQKLTLLDATGNRLSPYLDFVQQDFNWTTNGAVEFFGALWPGEKAWKLKVEAVRTGSFAMEELWEARASLPPLGTISALTNQWEHAGVGLRLVALGSPNAEHTGAFQWIAKWWGADRNQVYSLALSIESQLKGRRVILVGAVDQNGAEARVVQHGNQDSQQQAVFFVPPRGASEMRFTFALPRSRFVEFVARPEFVNDGGVPDL